jgi:Filamentous haemagglutinin family outer membrane protein
VLLHSQIAADVTAVQQRASTITARLSGTDSALASRLSVGAGIEVRAPGNLRVTDDLLVDAGVPNGAASTLTLRAAANLDLAFSLSAGFSAATSAAAAAQAGDAASMRLVAGADLAAADPLATRTLGGTGDSGQLTIGRAAATSTAPAPDVVVRSTVGDLSMAAAGDIRLLNTGARVYTTGAAVPAASLPELSRIGIAINQTLRSGNLVVGPFFDGAGDILLRAAGSIVGSPSRQYVTDWWWRQTGLQADGRPAAWTTRYDLFQQGVASFGGGHVSALAGRDIIDLELSTPATGFDVDAVQRADGSSLPALALHLPGGVLSARAGGNIVSGLFNAGGPSATLEAGDSIRPAATTGPGQSHPGAQLFYGNTQWTISALDQLTLGSIANPALIAGVVQVSGQARSDVITGLDNGASLTATSVAGDLRITGNRTALVPSTDPRNVSNDLQRQVPGRVQLAAPSGSVRVDSALLQRPVGDGSLQVLANDTVELGRLTVGATTAATDVAPLARATALNQLTRDWMRTTDTEPRLDAGQRAPVRVVARTGDVLLEADLASARPLRAVAGRDLRSTGSAAITLQHQGPGELSLLQAGRDIVLADNAAARVRIAGPGDLLLLAGRHVDLQSSAGITTTGNQDNPRLLPDGGATITVVAGVDWAGADYKAAATTGLLLQGGGAGLVPFLPQLHALAGGGAGLETLQGDDARQAVLALVDGAGWRRAVQATMQKQTGNAALPEPDALAAWQALAPSDRAMLGDAVATQLPAWQQVTATLARQQTGQPDLPTEAASVAWQELPDFRRASLSDSALVQLLRPRIDSAVLQSASSRWLAGLDAERQALLLHEVLFQELRLAGRRAARLPAGDARQAAYAPAYAALGALYPGSRRTGDIRLAASQIKTQQGGDIRLLAPGGGIDAGALTGSTGKRAADLGILTTAGGNIEAAARDDIAVNQSRVFTLARGDLLLWSSDGNIDAGRGARTVSGAPPPVYRIDSNGNVVVDTSGSFSGSGIAVLDATSILDLYAPRGEISAGEAGIKPQGVVYLGTDSFVGQIEGSGSSVGAPPPPPPAGATAALASAGQSATAASTAQPASRSDGDDNGPRRRRRSLLLEFLGFGPGE